MGSIVYSRDVRPTKRPLGHRLLGRSIVTLVANSFEKETHAPKRASSAARWIATICRISGLVSLATAVLPPAFSRFEGVLELAPLSVEVPARLVSIQAGLVLLVLARHLKLKKRRAWQLTLIAASVGLVGSLFRGVEVISAISKTSLIAALIVYRKEFIAEPDPPSLRKTFRFVPTYMVVVSLYAASTLFAYRRSIEGGLTLKSATTTVLAGLTGSRGPLEIGRPMANEIFYTSLTILGLVGVGALAYLLFRPVIEGVNSGEIERRRARDIVRRWGSDSLAYFALRDDKSYFFSDSGESVIAYRYINGVACVSGDPIGDPDEIPDLLGLFIDRAHRMGWRVAVLAGRESNESLYTSMGLKSFYIGDEALIDLEAFSLSGRPIRKVRQSCHRLEKRGYSFELLDASMIDAGLRVEMDAVAHRWRGRAPNRGFSMALNRHFEHFDSDCLVAVVRDDSGALKGFMKLVPFFGKKPGYSLDQICRDPDTPNGLSEYLVARTCESLQERGLKYLSLNFAAFSRLLSGEVPLRPLQKVQRIIVKTLNPYFQIESLYRFNKKFFPVWQPRALFYEEGINLVRVALSYLELEAFLRLGWVRKWLFPPLELRH
jgi:lysyl-tRNA synthetase class 2